MDRSIFALAGAALVAATGCHSAAPPPSQFPNGQAAIDRMRATYECLRGVRGEAKIDHMSEKGRIRGNLMFFAVEPASVRFDVVSPFGVTLATLTSDSKRFTMNDLREKKFLEGPASACNIARLTQVPIPGHALVSLLHGEAPVLVHQPEQASITWSGKGYYVVEIPSTRDASQVIKLAPTPADFAKPWSEQRVRVLDVVVRQRGYELYHADLHDHAIGEMAAALVDDDGIDPPVPPSGPVCQVEIPRRIHVEVPGTDDDTRFRYEEVKLNPPLPTGIFTQPQPGGSEHIFVGACDKLRPASGRARPGSSSALAPLLSATRQASAASSPKVRHVAGGCPDGSRSGAVYLHRGTGLAVSSPARDPGCPWKANRS